MRTTRRPRRRTARPALACALVLSVAGCGTLGEARSPFGEGAGARQIEIEVLNLNWNDATLHALRGGGHRERLGVVTGKGEARYTLDWPMSVTLRIEIDILAGGSCVTRELVVDPGDIIYLQIEDGPAMEETCRGIG